MHLKHTCLPISPPEQSGFFEPVLEKTVKFMYRNSLCCSTEVEFHLRVP